MSITVVDEHAPRVESCCSDLESPATDSVLSRMDIVRLVLVALALPIVFFELMAFRPLLVPFSIAVLLFSGWPIYAEAIRNLLSRRMTMELSMTIALLAAVVIGEFITAIVILFFVLVAEAIEELTIHRGRRAIRGLVDLLPRTAVVRREGVLKEVLISEIQISDTVVIKPGGRIPVDGRVKSGISAVDEAAITGESVPVEKTEGGAVFAGSINQTGTLEVTVNRLGRDTAFGKIVEAVERAERSRAPIQRVADRLAGYLVYFAVACAALTYIVSRDVISTISVIIVAGACGVAAGTPLAILGAIGRAAQHGAIIKGGIFLEVLGRVNMVVLDKTGTLTRGEPEVVGVLTAQGVEQRELLRLAAVAERRSEHPLSHAIVKRADSEGLTLEEPETFLYTPGKGIQCQIGGHSLLVGTRAFLAGHNVDLSELARVAGGDKAHVFVARDGVWIGAFEVRDVLRTESAPALRRLRDLGVRTVILSGDTKEVVDKISRELGIDEMYAELLPDEKVRHLHRLRSGEHTVAMVGDGINDAPALVEADIGVAMGSGTDVARESADVVLLKNDLMKFVETIELARRCHRIIMFNFTGTLVVDIVGVGLAAFGMLSPLVAAFIHVGSEIAFILNSARLLPTVQREGRPR